MGETYAGLSSKSKEDFGHGEAEFVPYMNVFTNPIADVAMTEAIEIDDRQAKVKNGDVLFTTSSETPEEVGMSSVWLKNGSNTYLNSFCFGFRASESINSYYLAYMLRSSGVRRKIVFLAQGISRYNISKKKMMEIKVPMPISAEQRQLGEIFRQLDNLITLHQRKQKCKFLSFPTSKAGLFLANSWEQRKLGGEAEELLAGGDIDKDLICESGRYPVIANALTNDGIVGFYEKYYRVEAPAVTVSGRGDVGHAQARRVNFTPVVRLLSIKSRHNVDFLENAINRGEVIIESTGVPQLTVPQLSKRTISFPQTVQEEEKIGKLFFKIDNLITLHQCKDFALDTNKAFQQRCLLSIKSANAWEQRKLGDVGKAQSGIGFPDREQGGKEGVPFYKVSDMNNYGNEHEMHSANNYVTEEQCRRNGWTPITEISVVFAKVGAAIMLNRKRLVRFSFLLDNNTMAYRFGSGWDINFGKTLFERVDLTELVQIGALPSYNATDVESVEISMPDKPEQYQIGEFFKQLDNLITLHQRKQTIKKRSKMDEKRRVNYLMIANAWEQREFNSIAKRITEMTDTEDLPRVEYEDIVSGQGTLNKDINKKKSCKTGILFDNGDVLFGKLRPYLKNWLFATFMGIAVGDFWVLRANNADGLYIYTLLQIDAFQDIANQSTGTKMPRADWSLVSKQRFLTPTVVPEQRKIGEFFKQLDNLITLHQRGLIKIQGDKKWQKRKFQKNCSAIILNAG